MGSFGGIIRHMNLDLALRLAAGGGADHKLRTLLLDDILRCSLKIQFKTLSISF